MTSKPARKTALVTGAALRVGRAISLSLAQAGYDLVLHYRRSQKEATKLAKAIEAQGRKAYLVQADLNDPAAVDGVFAELRQRKIVVDCLIHNASRFERDMLATMTYASWQMHHHLHGYAPLRLVQDFAAQYKGKSGNVIMLTDSLKGWSLSPQFLTYTLSKKSLEAAVALLAQPLAPRIRINAVAPGSTLPAEGDKGYSEVRLRKMIPLQHVSSPEEVCQAIAYILGAPSLTGQVIALSGGIA